jgi:hypothetical protein
LADRPALAFLRIAMEEQWIKAVKAARRSSSYNLWASRRFIMMEEAGDKMGLSREWVNFLVSTGRLRSVASVSDPQTTLVDVESIHNLFRDRRRLIATRMAAADLGISTKELFDLIAYGHLSIASGPQIDGCPDTALEFEALLNLYQRIEKISSPVSETVIDLLSQGDSAKLLHFDDVREQLPAKNLNLGLWLQAVIDGEVTPFRLRPRFIYDPENIQLANFAFRHDQIRQYLSRMVPSSA